MKKQILIILAVILVIGGFYIYKNSVKDTTDSPFIEEVDDNIEKSEIMKGRIVFGHEVRTFQPCGEKNEVTESQWIDGSSPAYDQIKNDYEQEMDGTGPYSPMYAEIIGRNIPSPTEGFGADYAKTIYIDEITLASATSSCKSDLIILENVRPGDYINPEILLEIEGVARGNWFFEADFPVQILDNHANVLGNGYASAQGEWMTTEFVPFKGSVEFDQIPPENSFGKLVLKKDNPSDLEEFDDQLEVLIYFGLIK